MKPGVSAPLTAVERHRFVHRQAQISAECNSSSDMNVKESDALFRITVQIFVSVSMFNKMLSSINLESNMLPELGLPNYSLRKRVSC